MASSKIEISIEALIKRAEAGDLDAALELADTYSEVDGSQNLNHAFYWYKFAADKGNLDAIVIVANLYYLGSGVAQSYDAAITYYKVAAERGDAEAAWYLGMMYDEGDGVNQDSKLANEYYQHAFQLYYKPAKKGEASAQLSLGYAFLDGKGVIQDTRVACEWFQRAADQGDAEAWYQIGVINEEGYGVPKDARKALRCYRRAAEGDELWALVNAADKYYYGCGEYRSSEMALTYYARAASFDDVDSALKVAKIVARKSEKEIFMCYKRAADLGNAQAQFEVGKRLQDGIGIARDTKAACEYFTRAQANGYLKAGQALLKLRLEEVDAELDSKKAAEPKAEIMAFSKGLTEIVYPETPAQPAAVAGAGVAAANPDEEVDAARATEAVVAARPPERKRA